MKKQYRYIAVIWISLFLIAGCGKESKTLDSTQSPIYIAEGIRKLSVTREGEEILLLSYEPTEHESTYEYWKIRVPYGEHAIVDTEAMLLLYHNLEALELKQEEVPEDESTGLDDSKTNISMEFCQTNRTERDAMMKGEAYEDESPSYKAEADSSFTLIIGNKNGEGYYYTSLSSNPENIYLMSEKTIDDILNTKPFDLIIKVSAVVNVDTVEQVEIHMDGMEYHFKNKEGIYAWNERTINEGEFQELYTELLSVLVDEEVKDVEKSSEDVMLKLYFKRNTAKLDDVEIIYHIYDETHALVSVNGVEKLLVKQDDIQALKDKIKSFEQGGN